MYKKNNKSFVTERLKNYEAEADKTIKWLKTDPKFCQHFLYRIKPNECNIDWLHFSVILSQTFWPKDTVIVIRIRTPGYAIYALLPQSKGMCQLVKQRYEPEKLIQ